MRICILCEDKNIVEARENCKNIFPAERVEVSLPNFLVKDKLPKTHLSIPVSETGKLPATHWFCFMSTNEEAYNRIINNKLYSTIEEGSPKEFLEKWNLKVIK
jgi:hypothetical protein